MVIVMKEVFRMINTRVLAKFKKLQVIAITENGVMEYLTEKVNLNGSMVQAMMVNSEMT